MPFLRLLMNDVKRTLWMVAFPSAFVPCHSILEGFFCFGDAIVDSWVITLVHFCSWTTAAKVQR